MVIVSVFSVPSNAVNNYSETGWNAGIAELAAKQLHVHMFPAAFWYQSTLQNAQVILLERV